MKTPSQSWALAASVLMMFAWSNSVSAAQIETACLKSERGAGKRALCGCIQDAANMTLSAKDQRLAATFFSDPHRAQEIRQSSRRHHEAFWDRYESFGEVAQTYCKN